MNLKQRALKYHFYPQPGKISIRPIKPCATAKELSLAYTPGVAEPCKEICNNLEKVYKYTSKSNLVGVITNGTAVLGLGDIGALASKPVMEGKSVLFKRFANIDAFDLEIDEKDPDKFIEIVASLEPSFGGINLEDIRAPECFYIQKELTRRMAIPIFHDDQDGTAVITACGLLNALELTKRKISKVKIVISGAGAAAIASAELLVKLGAKKKNIFMFDSQGLITKSRIKAVNKYKAKFAQNIKDISLKEVLRGAEVFIGLSKGGLLSKDMLKNMAPKPIVFALANPVPEIFPKEAKRAVPEVIIATGRSDYDNQVNNVLGFPFIFRGALDVRAKKINQEMKLAAVKALRELVHQEVPKEVVKIYGKKFSFGPDYIIPKPFDSRLLYYLAPAVAKAAMKSGIARQPINNFRQYKNKLEQLAKKLTKGEF